MDHAEFSVRMQQIVLALLKETEPVPVKYLAESGTLSARERSRGNWNISPGY